MDINFELYKIFYYAGSLESFSAAAAKLFISQSAVSQAIKSLEKAMEVQLFLRRNRAVKLTHEGEMLFRHVEQAYNFLKAGEGKMLELQGMNYGEVRIGASDTVCKYHLIPYIQKYTNLYPNIKIQLVNRISTQIMEILKNGAIDFGIVTMPVDVKNVIVEEFHTVSDIFVASSKFKHLKGIPISIKELCSNPLLMLPPNSATRKNLDNALNIYGMKVSPEIELESVDLLVEYAKIGLGISHVLRESAQQAIDDGILFEIETKDRLPSRKLGIVSTGNLPLSKSAEEFIKILHNI